MVPDTMDDPFASLDSQRTFAKPNPGGWPGALPGPAEPSAQADAAEPSTVTDHGLTPLLAAANRLLLLVPPLRQTRQVSNAATLRAALAQGIRDFEAAAQALGIAPERVMAARYVLCTMLDEAAADTPWGGGGVWGRHSLLAEFHNEAFGGEKVFQLMARLAEKPDANRDLLELVYTAVSLGFEGRYRVIPNGRAQLEAVRGKLAQLIRQQRGPYPAELAEHWAAEPVAQRRALSWLPLALSAALGVLLLGAVYAGFALSLGDRADPVYARIQGLRLAPPVAPVAQPAALPRLAVALQADVRAGLVAVRDEVDRSVVTLKGDGLFASGSATLANEREALLRRVADALVRVGGEVLVTGHTDNTPMRTLRFPSNWHLSEERARAVRQLLVAGGVPAERVHAEGRADGEPVVRNDSDDNRRLNRRVEIVLQTTRAGAVDTAAPAASAAASRASTSR
jgi:type VI secretion system protein ImpK